MCCWVGENIEPLNKLEAEKADTLTERWTNLARQ